MKSVFTALAFIVSSSAFAGQFSREQYICKESKRSHSATSVGMKMILTSTSRADVEGRPIRYVLQVIKGNKLVVEEQAYGEKNDVILNFAVKGKAISGMIFMDELDQTSLSLHGKELSFNCDVKDGANRL